MSGAQRRVPSPLATDNGLTRQAARLQPRRLGRVRARVPARHARRECATRLRAHRRHPRRGPLRLDVRRANGRFRATGVERALLVLEACQAACALAALPMYVCGKRVRSFIVRYPRMFRGDFPASAFPQSVVWAPGTDSDRPASRGQTPSRSRIVDTTRQRRRKRKLRRAPSSKLQAPSSRPGPSRGNQTPHTHSAHEPRRTEIAHRGPCRSSKAPYLVAETTVCGRGGSRLASARPSLHSSTLKLETRGQPEHPRDRHMKAKRRSPTQKLGACGGSPV
ncbi:hypothetical protein V8D89_012213 [Ganoderma adspersum]